MMLKEPFVLGSGRYPNWFKAIDQSNIDFKVREDSGELLSVSINLTGNNVTAKAGDVLGLVNDKIVVIPAKAAKQYM